ncbi:unnamed protein product [Rotaria sordida]|uniref:EB domain-containing protein n=1 Tax=Rotaria sordida TaxID=392033 RepID=A0A814H5H5_9BILA|nr:unnamed protein product [Rotaria sordida]CAF1107210.1 unnamed protein product [Rotaria sordida]
MLHKLNIVTPTDSQLGLTTADELENTTILSGDADNDNKFRNAPRIPRNKIDPNDFQTYAIDNLQLDDAEIQELVIESAPSKPISPWKKTSEVPRWLVLIFTNFLIMLVIATFCVVFIYQKSQVGLDELCLTDSNCNSRVGLMCTAGKCSCSAAQFWNGRRCVSQRTFNRSCTSSSQCNSLIKLACMNVTISSYTDLLCWCSASQYWTGSECVDLKTFNETCSSNSECQFTDFLTCINGRCDCNSTQFWDYEYCENKRSYGSQCFSNYWCNNATAGLQCSTQLPTAGTCDCLTNQYWWTGNNTCMQQLSYNSPCSFDYQCLTNLSLSCSSSTSPSSCQCADNYWYNSTKCTPKFLSGATCSSSIQCDNTVSLSCNLTAQTCTCNESIYVWDGTQCVARRSIGGACSSNNDCLASQNLVCATTGVWNRTCACPTNYYWNTSTSLCVIKKLWYQPCASSYECYDGGYLSCQPNAALNTTVCDCTNYTDYWTGFLSNTYSDYCTPKINYGVPSFTCTSSYQCRDYNYITCNSGQCTCTTYQYWDGIMCEARLNYSYPCNSTSMCRNWASGPNLQCLTPPSGGSTTQCLCTSTEYYDYCLDRCYSAIGYQLSCSTSSCYATSMCDQTKSLSCISNICNCTNTQWWNTASCVAKGTYSASCTIGQNYQCQEYNLLSCIGSLCQCSSVMYWSSSSNYCLSKQSYNGACSSTNECLTAAGVGLTCTSGLCKCASGYAWSSALQQCSAVPG